MAVAGAPHDPRHRRRATTGLPLRDRISSSAAEELGVPANIVLIVDDDIVDLDTLGWDDNGWFDERVVLLALSSSLALPARPSRWAALDR